MGKISPILSTLFLLLLVSTACQNRSIPADDLPQTLTAIPPAPDTPQAEPSPQAFVEPTLLPTSTHTPAPTPTPAFPPFEGKSPIPQEIIGIQVHPFGEDIPLIFQQLDELGVGWVKIQISWKLFEPSPGQYDPFWFGETDRFIEVAHGRGIKVMLGVAKAPEWSRPTTEEDGPPADLAHFTAFTQLLAERYQGRVAAYELWNEPNLRREWNGYPLNGEEFARLVKAGADGIRQVESEAVLISGAPAPTGINDGVSAIDDRVYFEQMLAAGIGDHVDAIGYHPYSASNPAWASMGNTAPYATSHNDHPSFFFSHTTDDYLDLMEKYGVDHKLWATEFGWGSFENLGKPPPAGAEFMSQLTEWEQAVQTTNAFVYAHESEQIGPLILWNLNFGPLLGADFAESGYAILRPDGSQRPAYLALKHMPKSER